MIRVVIESPYAGDVARNVAYAKQCVMDSLRRGEAPYASHIFFTQDGLLNDDVPWERERGISAGLDWGRSAEIVAFYVDHGISDGMRRGLAAARARCSAVEVRALTRPVTGADFAQLYGVDESGGETQTKAEADALVARVLFRMEEDEDLRVAERTSCVTQVRAFAEEVHARGHLDASGWIAAAAQRLEGAGHASIRPETNRDAGEEHSS